MAKYGKWIGAGLGLALGGPLGALFGLFIGSMFDHCDPIGRGTYSSGPNRAW